MPSPPGTHAAGTALDGFSAPTRRWFQNTFAQPTEVQERGWRTIQTGAHTLLLAPTGSGKTLAAMLAGIDSTTRLPDEAPPGVRVLYVSPLKALVYDVERNLRSPLVGILRSAERLEQHARAVRVDVRTGDTPSRERAAQRRRPGEILVTTPESLYLILGSQARETLATVDTVIVDEIHAVAGTKRGTHLALSLERLSEVALSDPQRIGLSATVRPLDEVAQFLGGDREVQAVDASSRPSLDLKVVVPVPDMDEVRAEDTRPREPQPPSGPILGERYRPKTAPVEPEPARHRLGVWPAVYPRLLELIRSHRSTIVFVNSRGLCERLAAQLNELAEEELVLAHHGSVSREKRTAIEEGLKRGELQGIVATSSLELGIDMGAVDQVLLVESPGSVARGLQRVGRAGHNVGERSRGVLFPKFKGDLLECAVLSRGMLEGAIEPLRAPRNALDVLAQQVIAMVVDRDRGLEELERVVRRAHPYRELTRSALVSVLEMLSGRYPSDDFADLRPRLAWDRKRDVLTARRGTAMITRMNAGTIPDRGLFAVHVGADGPRVGELDEEMVYETRNGDVILLGASSWRVLEITRDRVLVEPAPGESGRLPFWHGAGPGRPLELGRAMGALVAELERKSPDEIREHVLASYPLDELAAGNLADYVVEQREHSGVLPTDRRVVIERFRDELGDWRVCILTPFGVRVHAPWALALQTALSARSGFEVSAAYTDDGIVLTFADGEELPGERLLLPDPDELEDLVVDQLNGSALFGSSFRENAGRALLIPRRNPKQRTPLFLQRLKSKALLASVMHYPDFPVVLETYRQCLQDVFDLKALGDLLRDVRARRIEVVEVETRGASPFARSLVFSFVAAYLYEYDAPLAERRSQALALDRNLLRELLGEAELRELLDASVVDAIEAELQGTDEARRARDAEELSDLLRKLGALSRPEVEARCTADPSAWLAELVDQRRAATLRIAGEEHWIAAQDAGLYRDALGASPPAGLPDSFLAPVPDALSRLVARYARTHGPFTADEVARRLDLRTAQVEDVLDELARAGRVVQGAIDPRRSGVEWCDEDVLRRIKRATLARLRGEIAPVEGPVLARFLPAWQGVGKRGEGAGRLEEALAQLEAYALPWSALCGEVLPARVPGFDPAWLDELVARGEWVWIGRGPLGQSDGKVCFLRRANAAALLPPESELEEPSPLHRALLDHLAERGASFTTNLERAAREADPALDSREFERAMWDLVWAGLVTNDTCLPLRRNAGRGQKRGRRAADPLAGGRWSLVSELRDDALPPTQRAHAWATTLLERYGVVSREMASAEDLPGGFSAVYPVLRAMEEAGRIRRGHFVEGLTGAQFALAGAVDRLRGARSSDEEEVTLHAAVDPALPWGALLPWPPSPAPDAARPRRVAGATVVCVDGVPALWVPVGRRALLTFVHPLGATALDRALGALARLPHTRRSLVVEKVDGLPVGDSPVREALERAGFLRDYRGWIAPRA